MQGALNLVEPGGQATGASREGNLEISFDKLMMSSSLKPGRGYGDDDVYVNGLEREYLVFIKYTGVPLGYWCAKEDEDTNDDNFNDKTTAIIRHTPLGESSAYGFIVGSGVKDIYQNCYNPGADTGDRGEDDCMPRNMQRGNSCCKGIRETGVDKCYKF